MGQRDGLTARKRTARTRRSASARSRGRSSSPPASGTPNARCPAPCSARMAARHRPHRLSGSRGAGRGGAARRSRSPDRCAPLALSVDRPDQPVTLAHVRLDLVALAGRRDLLDCFRRILEQHELSVPIFVVGRTEFGLKALHRIHHPRVPLRSACSSGRPGCVKSSVPVKPGRSGGMAKKAPQSRARPSPHRGYRHLCESARPCNRRNLTCRRRARYPRAPGDVCFAASCPEPGCRRAGAPTIGAAEIAKWRAGFGGMGCTLKHIVAQ